MRAVKEFICRGEVLLLVIFATLWMACHAHLPLIAGLEDQALLRSGTIASGITAMWVMIYAVGASARESMSVIFLFVLLHLFAFICGWAATTKTYDLGYEIWQGTVPSAGAALLASIFAFRAWWIGQGR